MADSHTPMARTPSGRDLTGASTATSRSDRKLEEILNSAADLFTERGYAQTSVKDVAEAVGVLKGSLYYYIDSKEDLLFRVLLRNHQSLHAHVLCHPAPLGLGPMGQIRNFVTRHVDFVLDNHDLSALYLRHFVELSDRPDRQSEIMTLRRTYEEAFIALIEDARVAGEARQDADPALLARILLSMCNAAHQWFQPGGKFDRRFIIDHHTDVVVRAIQP